MMSSKMAAELREETFHMILGTLQRLGVHRRSPKFFIIYAHENNENKGSGMEAHQETVKNYISWFKEVLFNVDSDKSPHGYGETLEPAHQGASLNILTNQVCLLPRPWHDHNVDYVLLFYSDLLGTYMEYERNFKELDQIYSNALSDTCNKYEDGKNKLDPEKWNHLCRNVQKVQEKYAEAMGANFHNVMTELALLGFRNHDTKYIIPIDLVADQTPERLKKRRLNLQSLNIPDSQICITIESTKEYELFFKILLEFEDLEDDRPLIDALYGCFQALAKAEATTPEKYIIQRAECIENALRKVTNARGYWRPERQITKEVIRDFLTLCSKLDQASIQRVSGERLPQNLSDIDMAVVERPQSVRENQGKGQKPEERRTKERRIKERRTKERRTKERRTKERQFVSLHGLFDERMVAGDLIRPKRILIQGRPGMGKTTFCKRLMYEYSWDENLRKKFDLVVRIPIRKLESFTSLEDLLFDEYFRIHPRGDEMSRKLKGLILDYENANKETGNTNILILLDGLDEARGWSHERHTLLEKLTTRPVVIVTSRSNDVHTFPADLQLEALGLSRESVVAYLENPKVIPTNKAKYIRSFIESSPFVEDIVRVPIHLDILCYSWDEIQKQNTPSITAQDKEENVSPTITSFYQAVVRTLWRKDIPELDKLDHGEKVTRDVVNAVRDGTRLERVVRAESNLLEEIAFSMMESDRFEFADEALGGAIRHLETNDTKLPLSLERNVKKLSFLHFDDRGPRRRGSFLHLTFQEYFAARYFARRWKDDKGLELSCGANKESGHANPLEFLQRHKYTARYDAFWRFVAGLLDVDDGKETLCFFQKIEEEPRDLLGPTHQRLIMHCLSEVKQKETAFMELRMKLEKQLGEWLLFECGLTRNCRLAKEMKCPEQVLVNTLKQASENARLILLRSLESRAAIPSSVIDVAIPWLEDCTSKDLCIAILRIVRHPHKALRNTMLQGIAARLEDEDRDVQWAAIKALQSQANLTVKMLQDIAARLENKDSIIRWAAIEALQGRVDLTVTMLQGIAARLEHNDSGVREAAIKALQGQANLTKKILQGIAARLEDEDSNVKRAAIEALQGQANLTVTMLQDIAARLEHKDSDVQWAVIEALQGRANLTKKILQGIAARLEDEDSDVQRAAIEALQGQANLTVKMLQDIAARLKHKDSGVRKAAIEALQGQANLTEEILQDITAQLKDEDSDVQWAAIEALQGRANLTVKTLQDIAAQLKHNNSGVRKAAIKALQGQANLTEEIVQDIAARLEDEDSDVQWAAIKALQGQANLTKKVLEGIVARLENKYSIIRWAAIEALQGRVDLTVTMLQGIAARLEHNDSGVRKAAIEALQGRANLTKEVLQGIIARLEHNDSGVRRAAIEALQGQANLTEEILQDIAARLEDEDRDVQWAAIEALQGQANLTEEILQDIAARLEDEDRDVQWAAVKALQSRANLTVKMLQGIAARLEHNDSGVREAAMKALQGQANLTKKILQDITLQLEDEDSNVQWAAMKALQGQANLTVKILQAITARLKDEDSNVKRVAIKALQGRANLTVKMLQDIAAQLKHNNSGVRRAAIEALQGQANLTEEILQDIAAQLKHKDSGVRKAAIKALQGQANLTEEILQDIAARLEDEDRDVQWAAVKALQSRANLTVTMLQGIAARLKHKDSGVRKAAIELLVNQAALSLEALGPHVKPLYQALLDISFKQHLYLSPSFTAVGPGHILLSCKQEHQSRAKIWEIHEKLGVPPFISKDII